MGLAIMHRLIASPLFLFLLFLLLSSHDADPVHFKALIGAKKNIGVSVYLTGLHQIGTIGIYL